MSFVHAGSMLQHNSNPTWLGDSCLRGGGPPLGTGVPVQAREVHHMGIISFHFIWLVVVFHAIATMQLPPPSWGSLPLQGGPLPQPASGEVRSPCEGCRCAGKHMAIACGARLSLSLSPSANACGTMVMLMPGAHTPQGPGARITHALPTIAALAGQKHQRSNTGGGSGASDAPPWAKQRVRAALASCYSTTCATQATLDGSPAPAVQVGSLSEVGKVHGHCTCTDVWPWSWWPCCALCPAHV